MRIQVTLILFPSGNLHFPNFLQGKCLTLVVRKKIFFNIILFKATEILPPPPANEILYENSICGPNERGGGAHWVGIL